MRQRDGEEDVRREARGARTEGEMRRGGLEGREFHREERRGRWRSPGATGRGGSRGRVHTGPSMNRRRRRGSEEEVDDSQYE